MSAQTRYGFNAPKGVAGGIYDLAPYEINTLLNEENTGVMKFGFGVVKGTTAGVNAKLPVAGKTAADFEGVTVNNRTTEFDTEGGLSVKKGSAIGVMRYGRVYVQIVHESAPAYGDAVYLVISGDDAGKFTKTAGANTVAINARFIGGTDGLGDVAPIELFNQANGVADEVGATKVSELTDVDLTTAPAEGQVLKYDATAGKWKPSNDATE